MPGALERQGFHELGPGDRELLAVFPCTGPPRHVWLAAVREMIHPRLTEALERDGAEAIGLWVGAQLVAIAAWTQDARRPDVWRSGLLAIRDGRRRHGYGLATKVQVLQRAQTAGVRAVVSAVHVRNDAMLDLNARLGASMRVANDREHLDCVIDVGSPTWQEVRRTLPVLS